MRFRGSPESIGLLLRAELWAGPPVPLMKSALPLVAQQRAVARRQLA